LVLIALGAEVLRRLRRGRVHVHAHRHGDGRLHLHAHSHVKDEGHAEAHPAHEHPHPGSSRALVVGAVHGLAGSAALVLLALENGPGAAGAIGSLAAFGAGSVLGMVLFSLAISLPLRLSSRRFGPLARGVEAALGAATLVLGCWIVLEAFLGS
ncbi:MAG: urease accessory protein, partial [Candidatus Binatia bacterium]